MTGALAPGDPLRIGSYALAGRLGSGGQGVVYEAYDPQGGRVALKVLRADGIARPLGKEVTAAQRVSSFCTARILAFDVASERPYIASEFVDGPSLKAAVEAAGPYRADDLHRLATGVATAVAAIHEAGVVHRDLKPENVLLGPDGPRVIDFGIARIVEGSLTAESGLIGTPAYMAPELFHGTKAGPAADVFSWGAVVVFAATGRPAFGGANAAAIAHQVLNAEPDLRPLPEPLRDLVAAALAKDPAARPSARDLLLGLLGAGAATGPSRVNGSLLAHGSHAAAAVHAPHRLAAPRAELGELAEATYNQLDPADQAAVPRLLLRMIGASGDDLHAVEPGEIDASPTIAARFVEAGLLLRLQDRLTLANAALPHAWPRLRQWLADDRPGLESLQQIRTAAHAWETGGRRDGDLLGGSSLERATEWAATGRKHVELTARERSFLNASIAHARRRVRFRRLAVIGLTMLLVLSVTLGGLAELLRRQSERSLATARAERANADHRRDIAVANSLTARVAELRQSDPRTALRLSVAAHRIARTDETRSALLGSQQQRELDVLALDGAVRYDPPAKLALVAQGRDLETRRLPGGELVSTLRQAVDERYDPVFTADGHYVIAAEALWEAASGRKLRAGLTADHEVTPAPDLVVALDRPTDSRRLLRLPDLAPVPGLPVASSGGIAVDPAGRLAVVDTGKGFDVYDLGASATLRMRVPYGKRGGPESPGAVAVSPDGRLLTYGVYQRVALQSLDDPGAKPRYGEVARGSGEGDLTQYAVFSPDGRLLVSANGWMVQVWATATMTEVARFTTPGFGVNGLGLSREGVLSIHGLDGSVRVVDVGAHTAPRFLGDDRRPAAGVSLSPDTKVVATLHKQTLRFWDRESRALLGSAAGPWPLWWETMQSTAVVVPAMAFSPDGKTLALPRTLNSVVLLEVPSGRTIGTITLRANDVDHPQNVYALAFTPDGRSLTIASEDREVAVWDVRRLVRTGAVASPGESLITALAWSPDGRTLALSHSSLTWLWQPGGGRPPAEPFAKEHSSEALAWSPDGKQLVQRGENDCSCASQIGPEIDARAWVWDAVTTRPLYPPLVGHTNAVLAATYSHDGKLIATAGADGQVRLWDARTHRPVGLPVLDHGHEVRAVAFSADDTLLHTVSADGGVVSTNLVPDTAEAVVCARAGRGLTAAEWSELIPDVAYRRTC
ncbi:WD40 repeat domain-containing serine/threonine-protein kinase [Nonomuraea sp. NPDC050310]|uniref:WD40 repeat domain-containing serine/threonine-protein kinase n=1 Tax=Nonomuraea sp. NPDC050310 TaxID=3154935 RepID=UPI00340F0E87